MIQFDLLIHGEKVQNYNTTAAIAPFDKKILGKVSLGGNKEAELALESSLQAFGSWKTSSRRSRQVLLRKISEKIDENKKELAELMMQEIGKPIDLSYAELYRTSLCFQMCADQLSQYGGEWIAPDVDERGQRYRCIVERFPIGPIFGIIPYNWPYNLAAHKIGPAIATGNTIIVKPSPMAAASSMLLAKIIHEAGCPSGLVNFIHCEPQVAEKIALDPRIKAVSFTGSPMVGWHLKKILWQKKVLLELGGDAAGIVHEDADIDQAVAKLIPGAYSYAGQVCTSTQHIYVHKNIYKEFKEKFVQAVKNCPFGDPRKKGILSGPLINNAAAEKVWSWIQEAKNAGAEILAGGQREHNLIAPTLIENCPEPIFLTCEEVFGPVATLNVYQEIHKVFEKINQSKYGLKAGLFTKNQTIIEEAFKNLEVGGLNINDASTMRLDNMPCGGIKQSGFGREGIRYAFDEYTEYKTLLIEF